MRVAEAERSIQVAVRLVTVVEPVEIHTDIAQQLLRGFEIPERRLDVQCAAADRQQLALVTESVPLGVSPEVVVVVERIAPCTATDVLTK
jgi:hypothetical protein